MIQRLSLLDPGVSLASDRVSRFELPRVSSLRIADLDDASCFVNNTCVTSGMAKCRCCSSLSGMQPVASNSEFACVHLGMKASTPEKTFVGCLETKSPNELEGNVLRWQMHNETPKYARERHSHRHWFLVCRPARSQQGCIYCYPARRHVTKMMITMHELCVQQHMRAVAALPNKAFNALL